MQPEAPRSRHAVRLQRALADAGVASRRECESMIEHGRVQVNSITVTELPVFVNPRTDRVKVDGKEIPIGRFPRAADKSRIYIAVHKPDNTLATTTDKAIGEDAPEAKGTRRTILDLVKGKGLPRVFPVGRLGFHDTGLVLLTNDGELANRLTHARYGVPRAYRVIVRGRVPADALEKIRRKVNASLGPVQTETAAEPLRVSVSEAGDTALDVTLRESPRLRIDALIFEAGLKVKRLMRVAIGPISLRGIISGDWRHLNRHETSALLAAAGMGENQKAPVKKKTVSRRGLPPRNAAPRGPKKSRGGPPRSGPSRRNRPSARTDQR